MVTPINSIVGSVKKSYPAPSSQTQRVLSTLGKLVLLGVIGAGVAGNEVRTHQNLQTQAQRNIELNEEINQNKSVVDELNKLLANEHTLNQTQTEQMSKVSEELANSRTTALSFFEKINSMNREMSGKITLDQIMEVAKMVTPSTVMVEGEEVVVNHFTGKTDKTRGNGSGVILIGKHGERYILTDGHVTKNHEIKKDDSSDGVYHIKMYNGSDFKNPVEFDAPPVILSTGNRVFSEANDHDFALLLIPPDVKLSPNLGVRIRNLDTDPLKVGEAVVAVGSPLGVRDAVTFGIVSHADRKIENYNKNHFIQTDAPINFGNSGGGLFDMQGRLIGLNSWKYRGDGVAASARIDEIIKIISSMGVEL